MNNETELSRLRLFLLVVSGLLLVGTLVELVAINHTGEPIQLVPFVLSGIGLVAVGATLARPVRKVLLTLRVLMIPLVLGSLLGVWEHVQNNVAFYLEVHGSATAGQIIGAALGGRNPVVAPGMLALAAALAVGATYYHPALASEATPRHAYESGISRKSIG